MSERIDKAVIETRETIRRCEEILASVGHHATIDRASQEIENYALEHDRNHRTRLNRSR